MILKPNTNYISIGLMTAFITVVGCDKQSNTVAEQISQGKSAEQVLLAQKAVAGDKLANESQDFVADQLMTVKYGADTRFVQKAVSGKVACNNSTFGDPAPGAAKACYLVSVAATAQLASEGGSFTLAIATTVRYGAQGKYVEKLVNGKVNCNNATFGDPAPGLAKICEGVVATTTPPTSVPTTPTTDTRVAGENGTFTLSNPATVKYGANGKYIELVLNGNVNCNNATFGDPIPGVAKECIVAGAGNPVVVVPPVVTPPVTPPASVGGNADIDPAGIFNGKGGVSADAYRKMANDYGTAAMIPFRFGNDSRYYNPNGQSLPTVYAAPIKRYQDAREAAYHMDYTVGSPDFTKNDFSSNEAQVAYVTDPTIAESKPGVDRISTLFMDKGYFSATPQLYWNYQGYGEGHYGRPELSFIRDFMSPIGKQRFDSTGGMPSKPVDNVKAYGASEYAASSLLVFQNGLITAGGVATSGQNDIYYKPFPSNLVPTAASVTNHGEFALITLWDTNTQKAKLAVLSLGGSKPKDTFWNYEWQEVYPGFRNYSTWTFMKLLGYVDLPDMIAPTAVEAVGSEMIGHGLGAMPGNKNAGEFPLTIQSNWNCYKTNTDCKYNTSGFALVSSRYEKKVTIIDLAPLFQKVKRSMFSDYNLFRQNVSNVGMNDNQYPQTFSVDNSQIPRVVKTLSFDKQVTAISASLMRDNRALIALEDGTVQVFNMDGLQTGGSGTNITKTSEFKSGRNITRIAHMRHSYACCGDGAEVRFQFIISSRGDNKAEWYDFKQGRIIRSFQDSRILDLIGLEDNANHGTQSDVITILDYRAKTVRGYRYGPVIFHTNGGNRFDMGKGSDGKSDFEYSGEYKTPTGPFLININNVT